MLPHSTGKHKATTIMREEPATIAASWDIEPPSAGREDNEKLEEEEDMVHKGMVAVADTMIVDQLGWTSMISGKKTITKKIASMRNTVTSPSAKMKKTTEWSM